MSAANLINHLLFLASPLFLKGGNKARLSILIYHRVLEQKDPLRPSEPDKHEFEEQIKLLAKHCNILCLDKALQLLGEGNLPAKSVCITFDDGYRDNAEIAYPILTKYGASATFFIATGYLNDGLMFNDAIIEGIRHYQADKLDLHQFSMGDYTIKTDEEKFSTICNILPKVKVMSQENRNSVVDFLAKQQTKPLLRNLMMTTAQLKTIKQGGMSIGAHTVSHPILCSIDHQTAFDEISQSKQYLESLLNEEVPLFAYPNGRYGQDYSSEHAGLVEKAGFKAAVSTNWGVSTLASDRFQLPRFTPWDKDLRKFSARLIINGRNIQPLR
jgi:peptidoglycan/xylan/chitin deacetylase (PgdA/CDA1 family)